MRVTNRQSSGAELCNPHHELVALLARCLRSLEILVAKDIENDIGLDAI